MKKFGVVILLFALLLTACSGGQSPNATPLPTLTSIPIYSYVSPTPVPQIVAAVATQTAQTDNTEAITRGQGRYEALDCGSCHGANGEGSGDDGPALTGMTLSEADFITYLRSGGPLGVKHQYATNRLSDQGAHNLYLYLQSLAS
jgi:mono/diheme cytochrome c family protein